MRILSKLSHLSEILRLAILLAGLVSTGLVATLVWFIFVPPLLGFVRAHERLPKAVVEDRHTVYCRMRYCDFRFPLPSNSVAGAFGKTSGGSDTITGSLRVTSSSGTPLDLPAYNQLLQRHGFHAETADGASLFASSTKPLGGSIKASLDSATTGTIRFAYFGDF